MLKKYILSIFLGSNSCHDNNVVCALFKSIYLEATAYLNDVIIHNFIDSCILVTPDYIIHFGIPEQDLLFGSSV
jgi:hypothetical protein